MSPAGTAVPDASPDVTIALIDDTPDIRLLLRTALRRRGGFVVVGEAGDGRAGVELVARTRPDVAVLDLAMPVLDGLRALPLIREASPDTTVVVLSGFQDGHMAGAAMAAGAAAYVQKGASPTAVVDAVLRLLDRSPEPASPPGRGGEPLRVVDPYFGVTVTRPTWERLINEAHEDGLIGLASDGVIELWNAAAARITGQAHQKVHGRHLSALFDAEDGWADFALNLLDAACADGSAEDQRWLPVRGGSRVWVEMTVTALRGAEGQTEAFAIQLRDGTVRRRVTEAQTTLFASVSHDLRAPITAIRAFASLLGSAGSEELPQFAERIDANAAMIEDLVLTLFDHAKLRSGVVTTHLDPVAVHALVTECVNRLSSTCLGYEVVVSGEEALAMADDRALRRIVDNLFGNAVKYSPVGTRIEVHTATVEDRVEISVHDQGRGIHPDDLDLVVGAFVRGRLAESDGGTGLGLATVDQLTRMQKGDLHIDSQLGVGTTVTVRLPRA